MNLLHFVKLALNFVSNPFFKFKIITNQSEIRWGSQPMVDLRLNSWEIRKVRISEKFCDHIFQCQKLTQKMKFWFFLPTQFSKNCKIKFKISEWDIYLKNGKFWKNLSKTFRKLRGQKKIKISFFLSVFDTEKYGHKIFPKFELFGFFRN